MTLPPVVCVIESHASNRHLVGYAIAAARMWQAPLHLLRSALDISIDNRELPRDVDVRLVPVPVDSGAALASYVRQHTASLVVLSMEGHVAGQGRRGPAIRALASSAACQVLIVPSEAEDGRVPRPEAGVAIVCPVDFETASGGGLTHVSTDALNVALALADRTGGRLTLLHVLRNFPRDLVLSTNEGLRVLDQFTQTQISTDRRLRNLSRVAPIPQSRIATRVVSGGLAEQILETAALVDADLIVIGARPRAGVDEVLFGSTLHKLLRRAACPVLVVPQAPIRLAPPAAPQRPAASAAASSDSR